MRKPKYRRHTTRDLAFIEYNGKRTYLPGKYKSTESLAAYRAFLRSNGLLLLEVGGKPQRVVSLVNRFMDWAENNYPVGTRSEWMNCKSALKHLLAIDGATLIADYGPARLKALQQRLAAARKSRGYVNAVCARVRRAFKWGVSEGIVDPSVYHSLTTVTGLRAGRSQAVDTAPRLPVQWEQVAVTLPELSATVAAMVQLQWLTGVRSQSICHAQAKQFNLAVDPWEWRPIHKTQGLGHNLVVFVGPRAQQILRPFLESGSPYLFQPKHLSGQRARGYRSFYDSVSYMRAISRAQERVNAKRAESGLPPLERWTPHQIRHAKATAVRVTHGLEGSQAVMGHKTIDAAQIYAATQTDLAREIALEYG